MSERSAMPEAKDMEPAPTLSRCEAAGTRSLSLRLGQNPVPPCGPSAFALAPLQAPSLSASPRFPVTLGLGARPGRFPSVSG